MKKIENLKNKVEKINSRQRPKIIERNVIVYTLVDKSIGNCGGNPYGFTTSQYDPCVLIPKGKQVGDIYDDGRFATKDEKLGRNVFFKPNEYTKKSELQKKYLMYGLIAVVGYFAYKKLK